MSRCVAVVTDIWRTDSGRSQRFTEPLAPPVPLAIRPGKGPVSLEQDRWVIPLSPRHSPRNLLALGDRELMAEDQYPGVLPPAQAQTAPPAGRAQIFEPTASPAHLPR